MSRLKTENVNKCISLLRDYIEETSLNNGKEIAILALNQLQTITAGDDPAAGYYLLSCDGKPRASTV
jgi:hypothetical protein